MFTNFTVNACGGPTYLGAMGAHYLDLLVLMGAAAWLLHLILLPDPANPSPYAAPRSHPSRSGSELPQTAGVAASAGRTRPKENR